jgi:cytidine deaminase
MSLSQEERQHLVEAARQARQWAYTPYSHYQVGAALLTASGKVYVGVNIENASYSATICAERVAAVKAISEGERQFTAIAVVTDKGGMPCGVCRQFLSEFGLDTIVLIADDKGTIVAETSVGQLLPFSFGAGDLSNTVS